MKFGPASPADAIGGVTVHTLRQGSLVLKKGTTIGPAEVESLTKAGVNDVVVVRLEPGDVSEDAAAASIAQAVAGEGIDVDRAFTGRANLFAAHAGVLVIDRAAVDRINSVDEAITFATLAAFKPVVEGEMVATVKLIPFGVEARLRDAAVAATAGAALRDRLAKPRDVLRVQDSMRRRQRRNSIIHLLLSVAPQIGIGHARLNHYDPDTPRSKLHPQGISHGLERELRSAVRAEQRRGDPTVD